jgi:protein SCO1
MKKKIFIIALPVLTVLGVLVALRFHQPTPRSIVAKQTFQVHGRIRSLDRAHQTIVIAHEEIPGYMSAMTMPLQVKAPALFKGLEAGNDVQFELSVTEEDSWISHIEKILPEQPVETRLAEATQGPTLRPSTELLKGELIPDFNLIDQNGRPIRLCNYRGKAVVLTFIFTRCPLPNFCPLMSKNFAALQERLSKEFPGRFQLLSISIDPQFDRPAVMKDYAGRYNADESCWSFATGDPEQIEFVGGLFGLVREPEGGLISHNLRTALIGSDGRLVHLWKSNVWTPYEIHRMVSESFIAAKTYSASR